MNFYFAQPKLIDDKVNTNSIEGIFTVAANAVKILFWVAGVAAVLIIIVAGIQYIMSAGDPNATSRAKTTITNAVIGLLLVIFAYALVNLIVDRIT